MDDDFSLGDEPMESDSDLFEIEGDRLVSFKFPDIEIDFLGVPSRVRIIGARAFAGCCFERIDFLGEIEAIEEEAFCDCKKLENVSIPGTVRSIGSSAFFGCDSLAEVYVSEGVEVIGDMAFANCGIERIDLPRSVSFVSPSAFFYSDVLNEINVDAGNETYSSFDGSLYTKDMKTLVCPRRTASNFTVADDAESVGEFAFYGYEGLVSVTLSPATASIEEGAFSGCESLKAVKMPGSLRFIGDSAFNGCSSLSSLKIPASVTHIGNGAFRGCDRFDTFEFEDPCGWTIMDGGRCEDVDPKALRNPKKLRERLTGDADMERNRLEKSSGEPLPRQSFSSRDPFEEDNEEDDAADDGLSFGFEEDGCDTSLFEIEDGKVISFLARDREMDVLCIPSDVTAIGEEAFRIAKFKAVRFFGGVKVIEDDAFVGCANLRSISLPDGLESLGECVFDESALEKLTLPRSLISIPSGAFRGTKHLSEIAVDGENKAYKAVDGNLYTRDGKTLVCAKRTATDIDIPRSVTAIGDFAFENCRFLEEVSIPAGVTSIGDGAFRNCVSLEYVDLPAGVKSIGECAFAGCSSLEVVDLPSGMTTISDGLFADCVRLEFISFPSGLTSIGDGAFFGCISLGDVHIPAGVTTMGDGAFKNCVELLQISLPKGLTSIGNEAFFGCSMLEDIDIPDSVTTIGHSAFRGCFYIGTMYIPFGVTSIGPFAFIGCDLFGDFYFGDPNDWTYTEADGVIHDIDADELLDPQKAYVFMTDGDGRYGIKKKR